jgi:hypothetical protein
VEALQRYVQRSKHGLGKARQKVASPRNESLIEFETRNRLSGGDQDTAGFYKIIRQKAAPT